MLRRLPIIPTVIVAAAAAAMIALGIWQLERARWKEGILARYAQAERAPPIEFPTVPLREDQLPLFRHATGFCLKLGGPAGDGRRKPVRRAGLCPYRRLRDRRRRARDGVELGWSKNPNAKVDWAGGLVSGIIAPDRATRLRLVAASAPPGLEPSAPPSLDSHSQQPPFLCAAMVRVRGDRTDHLWAGGAQTIEGTAKP